VDITKKLQKIGVSLTKKGLITILEEIAVAVITSVELLGVSRKQSPHNSSDRGCSRSQKKMNVVGNKRPGIAGSGCFGEDVAQAGEKIRVILGVFKDRVSLYTPDNDMVESTGSIDSCFTRH
jgi:hypothetical protein